MKRSLNKGLGKGLDALLASSSTEEDRNSILDLSINQVDPAEEQPRKQFDQDKLEALAESIRAHGVVQPVIVRKQGERFTLVAGNRQGVFIAGRNGNCPY
jgi:ParB family chromosome partitioning protein